MNKTSKVAVTSRSFSKHPVLREELLARYENVTFNDEGLKLVGEQLVDFLRGHDKAITALEKIDDNIFALLPELKVISKYGVGVDMIDIDALRRNNIRFGWKGGVNKRSVSEMTIACAISLLRHFSEANQEVRNGVWRQHIGHQLSNQVVGIIGFGHIGKDLGMLLSAFGTKVLAYDILNFPEYYEQYNITPVSLEELLKISDIVTLHVPLDDSTRNILSKDKLNLMKTSALLINHARGGLVDELELKLMLKEGRLAGAAFDVFSNEPPDDLELLNIPNFFVTPHIGGSAEEGILAMGRAAIDGLEDNSIPM